MRLGARTRVGLTIGVAAAVLAACGGGDDGEDATAREASSTTTTTSARSGGSTTTAGPSGTSVGGNSSGTDATTTTTSGGSRTAGTDDAARAAEGTYTYSVQGSATFGATEQQLPPSSKLVVDHVDATDHRQTMTSGDNRSESVLRTGDDGLLLVSLETSQGGFTKTFRPKPPVLFAPVPLKVGAAWSWTMKSTDGATTVQQTSKAVRAERRTVGGVAVDTIVVESTVTLSGDVDATTNQTTWAAPSRGLSVRIEQTTDGRFGAVTFRSESTMQLKSLSPA